MNLTYGWLIEILLKHYHTLGNLIDLIHQVTPKSDFILPLSGFASLMALSQNTNDGKGERFNCMPNS